MSLILIFFAALQNPTKEVLFLSEKVEISFEETMVESYTRSIWVGKNRVRTDIEDGRVSLIYDLTLHTMYVLDHHKQIYFISLTGRDKKLSRPPFFGVANQQNGVLKMKSALIYPTGLRDKINDWTAFEYKMNYPKQFGVTTRIWSVPSAKVYDKNDFRKLWFAAIGTNPPFDVRQIIDQILNDLNGVPIRTVTEVNQEGILVRTVSTIDSMQKTLDVDPHFFAVPKNYKFAPRKEGAQPWKPGEDDTDNPL